MLQVAVAATEAKSSAEIVVVVAPASDGYVGMVLLYGFMGSLALLLGLWGTGAVRQVLYLVLIQYWVIVLLFLLPTLRLAMMRRLLPADLMHQRCERRALQEYHAVMQQLPSDAPMIILYVSKMERYAQFLYSPAVKSATEHIVWEGLITQLLESIRQDGLVPACIQSIHKVGDMLAMQMPENYGSFHYEPAVIECLKP